MRPNPPPPHTTQHYEVAAQLREALLADGWTLRHDSFGDFVVRKDINGTPTSLKVTVYSVYAVAILSRKTAKGGYKKEKEWRQERNLDGSLPVPAVALVQWI